MGLIYNNVNLSYVKTESIAQGEVYDPSGTDQLYTKINISVQAYLSPGTYPSIGGETPGETAARIRHLLTAPRRSLVYTGPDGAVLVNIPNGLDDANGPKPDKAAFRLQQLTSGSYLVRFAVEAALTDCNMGALPPDYLSLRWAESTSYDRSGLCTKRRTGYLILSSLSPTAADDQRGLISPSVPPGFVRESAEYALSEDNLTYRFSFLDKERMRMPPAPALSVKARQSESLPLKGGLRRGHLSLRLDGAKGTDASDLLAAAIRIGMDRVFASSPMAVPGGTVLVGGGFAERFSDNENAVELELEWNMQPVQGRSTGAAQPPPGGWFLNQFTSGAIGDAPSTPSATSTIPPANRNGLNPAGLPLATSGMGNPYPGSDPGQGIAPPTRGTADGVAIVAAALNDPCGSSVQFPSASDDNELVGTTPDGATLTVTQLPALPDDYQALYADPSQSDPGVYDHYLISARFLDDTGQVALPATSGSKAIIVRCHGGLAKCSVGWSAVRIGGPPTIPTAESADDNFVYLAGAIEPDQVELAADGVTEIHTICGVYEYAALDRTLVNIASPVPPYLQTSVLRAVAQTTASLVSDGIVLTSGQGQVNPFTGMGTQEETTLVGETPVGP